MEAQRRVFKVCEMRHHYTTGELQFLSATACMWEWARRLYTPDKWTHHAAAAGKLATFDRLSDARNFIRFATYEEGRYVIFAALATEVEAPKIQTDPDTAPVKSLFCRSHPERPGQPATAGTEDTYRIGIPDKELPFGTLLAEAVLPLDRVDLPRNYYEPKKPADQT